MAIACQRCNKTRATVHLLDLHPGGENREYHFCDSCAAAEGVTGMPHEPINAILQKFIHAAATSKAAQESASIKCPDCGVSLRDFRQNGLLGCPNDYTVFGAFLDPLIERAHEGATQHIGKVPSHAGSTTLAQTTLLRLRRQLNEAVDREDYKSAARLKSQIEALGSHDAG